MRYGMMIELDKCVGCQACVAACKERWDSGTGAARDWVKEFEHGTRGHELGITFYPGLCNHCADHPCTRDCPTGATFADANGVVVVDRRVCIGCGNCISMCPYGARHADGEQKIVEKCNFCAPYVARGEVPACVSTCLAECRHFGDLDNPTSQVAQLIRRRGAQPLVTAKLNLGPKIYYAPEDKRQRILAAGVVGELKPTALTRIWQRATRPAARVGVPLVIAATATVGLLSNLAVRKRRVRAAGEGSAAKAHGAVAASAAPEQLLRHGLGLRVLHWFNAFSWVLLVLTGTALFVAPSFALFGVGPARWLQRAVGGPAALVKLHVMWGLLWAVIIVPTFIYLKRFGLEALKEIRLTGDDMVWLLQKPLVMFGLSTAPLPPQDKYNAGQKVFAASALGGTALIIASGVVLTLHLGSPEVIRAAILVHKLAIGLALVGVAVHITMAALIVDERPALKAMLTGYVDARHAASHSTRWVDELRRESRKKEDQQ